MLENLFFRSFRSLATALLLTMGLNAQAQDLTQELVFVHMDNTCYFLGDTLYYKAYVQRSDTGRPTDLSGVLYVELLNQDGYLMERDVLRLKNGQADGTFCLADTLYSGFYELRAYTRWQLNFGRSVHPHSKTMEQWFLKKEYAQEFFVDYDKLYSRVFPVYDKPHEPGEYFRDMTTTRPLRRDYAEEKHDTKAHVGWFPEGGSLVAGLKQRIAFEANSDEGMHLQGRLAILDAQGDTIAVGPTENRGRGIIEVALQDGNKYNAVFIDNEGNQTRIGMPAMEASGAVMSIRNTEDNILADIQVSGVGKDSLQLCITACGRKRMVLPCDGSQVSVSLDSLPAGVAQLTLRRGSRILADRLVFVHKSQLIQAPLQIEGMKESYKALERVELGVKGPAGSTVSMAVRDRRTMDPVTDNGNIMTEMLLSSHIKGFVEDPLYYFEADDSTHRRHLDLLLMVQGWRRFGHELKELAEPYEISQVIRGEVCKYTPLDDEDIFYLYVNENDPEERMTPIFRGGGGPLPLHGDGGNQLPIHLNVSDSVDIHTAPLWFIQSFIRTGKEGEEVVVPIDRPLETHLVESAKAPGTPSHLHAEFVQPGSTPIYGDMTVAENGKFTIQAPHFYTYCLMYLAAATPEDALKAEQGDSKKKRVAKSRVNVASFQWLVHDGGKYPKYSVRVHRCYPNFVEPYAFYHTQFLEEKERHIGSEWDMAGVTQLKEVKVKVKRHILRKVDWSKPTMVLDAYDAFNRIVDAGLTNAYFAGSMSFSNNLARLLVGDMGLDRAYNLERRWDGFSLSDHRVQSMTVQHTFNHLDRLDKVYIYTDYAPRKSGSEQYYGSDQPSVVMDLRRFEGEATQSVYRDRYCMLQGYEEPLDFYHPDYSRKPLPSGQKDYRRTLYWNPNLKLDQNGQARITFYNNSRQTTLDVDAEGQNADGTLLWGRE